MMTDKTAVEAMAEGIADTGLLEGDEARSSAQTALDAYHEWLKANGFAVVPVEPSLAVKMAGAEAITEDHMRKMANYDAAVDCWRAMIAAAQGR